MTFFKNYYKHIIKQDCINKFITFTNKDIPNIKEVTLNFGCKEHSTQKLAIIMLALEVIVKKKGTITTSKTPNVLLKIQKGQPVGCKVTLKKNEIYSFIERLNLEIFPSLKNFSELKTNRQQSNFFFQLQKNNIHLQEFERSYPLFANLPLLDINIRIYSKCNNEIKFLAKSMKLLIK